MSVVGGRAGSVCLSVPCEEDISFHWRGLLHIPPNRGEFGGGGGSGVMCHVSCVTFHMSCVTFHVSHVMCHISCVMCHVSPVRGMEEDLFTT